MCWVFKDSLQGTREILQAKAGYNSGAKKLRAFNHHTEIADNYHHYNRHLIQELLKKETGKSPVWASLSMVDPNDKGNTIDVMVGKRIPGIKHSGCA
jgi:hypothetical protein